jgi:hypothetical protein
LQDIWTKTDEDFTTAMGVTGEIDISKRHIMPA